MKFSEIREFNVCQLRCEKSYQRKPEPYRWQEILESIKADGYYPARPIIVTEDMNIFDGQHRWIAAKMCGLKKIPGCIVSDFKDEKEESSFFAAINNHNSRLNPADYWSAKHQAGDPLACLLYNLAENPQSLLYGKIQLRGHNYGENFNIGTVFVFIYTALCNSPEPWSSKKEISLSKKIFKIPEHEKLERINEFVEFFFDCFGRKRRENPLAFMCPSVRAFGLFYLRLKETIFFQTVSKHSSAYLSSVAKMRKFTFPPTSWRGMDHFTKFACFANLWNSKKTLYRVDTTCRQDIQIKQD